MQQNLPEGFTVFQFPRPGHKRIRTINGLENLNKQIRRRTRVVGIFPNVASAMRLISAVLAEIHEDWLTGRQYLNLARWNDTVEKPVPKRNYNHTTRGRTTVNPQEEVTGLLLAWGMGEESALGKLIPSVEAELRRLAHRCLAGERADHTLQTTALVNEAYLKLIDCRRVNWQNRAHFLALSAQLMRRILVDYARSRRYQKRGGGAQQVTLDEGLAVSRQRSTDLLAVDEAQTALAQFDPRKARVVEMRFFGGLSVKETAEVLKVSEDTVLRDWRLAKIWLLRELSGKKAEQEG